jgi:ferric enterobactin receptor
MDTNLKNLRYIIAITFSCSLLSLSAQEKSGQDSTRKLKEVAVTAKKALIRQKPDRIIYNLQADPESKGNSVFSMMKKIPYLSLDAAEQVLLKGNSNFKVLINGKPSVMMENNLTDLLKSMPANTIQSIEVITIPPSRYDAEGLAGIINIITIKRTDSGYSGTLNINGQFPAGGPGAGGSFTLKQGKLGISTFGGASRRDVPETGNSMVRATTGALPSVLTQTGRGKNESRSRYFGTDLSYEIDTLNLLSGQFNFYGNHAENYGTQDYRLEQTGAALQEYRLANSAENSSKVADLSVNYQLGFKADKNRLLTFSYRYSNNIKDQNHQILVVKRLSYLLPDYLQNNQEQAREQTAQVDFVYPLQKLTIETGIKAIFRDQESDFQYLSAAGGTGGYTLDPARSDLFNYTQKIFSAYNSYALNLKSWSFQGGLRIEQTVIDADYFSSSSRVSQNYFRVIPSLSASRNFAGGNSLNFGFTQRIKRPGINRLNPFVNRSNPIFESSGNPDLQPVLVNDLQVGYMISGKTAITIGLDYSFLRNADLAVAVFDPLTQITRTTYKNTGRIDGLSGFLNVSRSLTKRWSAGLNGNMIYFWIAGEADDAYVVKELLCFTLSLTSGYGLENGWRINGNLDIQSRNPTGFQGTTNGMLSSGLSVNKEIIKDKLSVSAVANNIFVKYRDAKTFTSGTTFSQTSIAQQYFSSYRMSLNYNFGGLKGKIKKNKRAIENNDQSN